MLFSLRFFLSLEIDTFFISFYSMCSAERDVWYEPEGKAIW